MRKSLPFILLALALAVVLPTMAQPNFTLTSARLYDLDDQPRGLAIQDPLQNLKGSGRRSNTMRSLPLMARTAPTTWPAAR